MSDELFGLVEMLLIFGIVLGGAWWELRSLRRGRRPPEAGSSSQARHPEGK